MFKFEIDKLYKVSGEDRLLGRNEFYMLYLHLKEKSEYKAADLIEEAFPWDNPGELGKLVDDKGTAWTKRFSNKIYEDGKGKVSTQALALVGSFLTQYSKNTSRFFEFTKYADWEPGNFGERDATSCWWNTYQSSRLGLMEAEEGFAVLYYENEEQYKKYQKRKGIGRHWLWNGNVPAIFNCYGQFGLDEAARTLSSFSGLPYIKGTLTSPGTYINKGNKQNLVNGGIAGGGPTGICFLFGTTTTSLQIRDFRKTDFTCPKCGKNSFLSETHTVVWDNGVKTKICRECSQNVKSCQACGNDCLREHQFKLFNDGRELSVCSLCYNRAGTCEVHGKTYGDLMPIFHTTRHYCAYCKQTGEAAACSCCRQGTDNYVIFGKLKLCVSCFKKLKKEGGNYHGHQAKLRNNGADMPGR